MAKAQNTLPYLHNFARTPSAYSSESDKIVKSESESPARRPHYNYNYKIEDPYSGDRKTHVEIRHGNVVQGSYSLIEPDGTRRIVDYYADSISGFKAEVRREILHNKFSPNSNNIFHQN